MFGPLDTQWLIRAALACLALTALPLCALADDAAKGDVAPRTAKSSPNAGARHVI